MKRYLALLLVIIAILLSLPWAIGFKVEDQYQAVIQQFEQNGFLVSSHSYRRGWFGASAETEFKLRTVADAAGSNNPEPVEIRLILASTIAHGPLTGEGTGLAQIESEVRLDDREGLFSRDYFGVLRTLVGLDGRGYTLLEWPPVELSEQAGRPEILFGGLSGQISFDLSRQTTEVQISFPNLTLNDSGSRVLEMGAVTLDSNSWVGKTGLTLGNGTFNLNSLTVSDPEIGERMVISDLGLEVESSEQGDVVGGVASYRVRKVDVGGVVYGPGLFRIELARLSGPVLLRVKQAVNEMRQQPMSEIQQGMALMSIAMSSGPELLRNDPGISLEPLRLATPDGMVEGKFSLRSAGLRWEDIYNRQKLLGKLLADLSLRMPEVLFRNLLEQQLERQITAETAALAEQADAPSKIEPEQLQALVSQQADRQMNQWLDQQVLVRKGQDITAVASLSGGLLTVNGKQIPLPY